MEKNLLHSEIYSFKKQFFKRKLFRGLVFFGLSVSLWFIISLLLESWFYFGSTVRLGLFMVSVLGIAAGYFYWVNRNFIAFLFPDKFLSDEKAAVLIGGLIPGIEDRLLNLLQLNNQSDLENKLLSEAIARKSKELRVFEFPRAINFASVVKLSRWLFIPALIFLMVVFVDPTLLTGSSYRIVNFNKDFLPPAPYSVIIDSVPSSVEENARVELSIHSEGKEFPEELFLFKRTGSTGAFVPLVLKRSDKGKFSGLLSFDKEDIEIYAGNPESRSEVYTIKVLKRPRIKNFSIIIDYPEYTALKNDTLDGSAGDFSALKGSQIIWSLSTEAIEKESSIEVLNGSASFFEPVNSQRIAKRRITEDFQYRIKLIADNGLVNADSMIYSATMIQDLFPSVILNVENEVIKVQQEGLLSFPVSISDDFGFSKLEAEYTFKKSTDPNKNLKDVRKLKIDISNNEKNQVFEYALDLSNEDMQSGDEIELFLKVWDNDRVSGPKMSKSFPLIIKVASTEELYEELKKDQDKVEDALEKLAEKSAELKKDFEKLQDKLLEKKALTYEDKKEVEKMYNNQKEINKNLQETEKQMEKNNNMMKENEMVTENMQKKMDQLKEILKQIKDPKLEEALKKLNEQLDKIKPDQLNKEIEKSKDEQEKLKEDLERSLELLKMLKIEAKVQELIKKLDETKKLQDDLKKATEDSKDKKELSDLKEKQDNLNDKMDKLKEDLSELKDLKKDSENPDKEKMDNLDKKAEDTKSGMKQSSEKMKAGDKNGAKKEQEKASDSMEKMMEMLDDMQLSINMEQDKKNVEDLRDLIENLLMLSFDQEELRDEVKTLKIGDPLLNKKAQQQKKIREDMEMVKDSLYSLAKRSVQIEKLLTDETNRIIEKLENASLALSEKQIAKANADQQAAMTGMNNLANMMSEAMQQMMNQMKNNQPGKGMCNKPGGKKPSMSQLSKKQKDLNAQMWEQMKGGKPDPKKMAQMAAEQELIRQQLDDAFKQLSEEGKPVLGDKGNLAGEMKKTEDDLVNQMLTQETLLRQQQILNKMLDAQKSVRERDFEEERKSKTAENINSTVPLDLPVSVKKEYLRREVLQTGNLSYQLPYRVLIEKYFELIKP